MARVNAIAAVWGFAEATLFFFVPDVYLSRVALRAPRLALSACGSALLGALVGGALMFGWGTTHPRAAEATLDRVPGISHSDVVRVGGEIENHGMVAVFLGPMTGTPYKIYAVEASVSGIGLLPLLAVSVPARWLRFVLVTLLAIGLMHLPRLRELSLRSRHVVHAAAWAAFYVFYFAVTGL